MELHGTLGPARTSMSAVAAHAGVRRSTLYRHFPDEAALFDACTAHWAAANPPPDLAAWAAVADPDERLAVALGELHAYYGRTERMLDNLHRDEAVVPLIAERFAAFHAYLAAAQDTLMAGRRRRRRRPPHPGRAGTRRGLLHLEVPPAENGLSEADAVGLLRALVAAA